MLPIKYPASTKLSIQAAEPKKVNKRILLMFCAFDGPPKIVRLHGEGEAITPEHEDFENLNAQFPYKRGTRAYIVIKLNRISDSCGYSVPLYQFVKDRDVLDKWVDAKTDEQLKEYRLAKNAESIDGLKGL